MSKHKPTDGNGVEIGAGDLVVSHDIVGIVKNINEWGSINVRYERERDLYAYEKGAPDVPYEYKPYGWNYSTRNYEYGEPETRYKKDMRAIGKKMYEVSQVRVNTSDIVVLRKADGTIPEKLAQALAEHQLVFPGTVDAPDVE